MESSPSIWHLLHNVKLTVKIFSNFVAFLENVYFIGRNVHRTSRTVVLLVDGKKADILRMYTFIINSFYPGFRPSNSMFFSYFC